MIEIHFAELRVWVFFKRCHSVPGFYGKSVRIFVKYTPIKVTDSSIITNSKSRSTMYKYKTNHKHMSNYAYVYIHTYVDYYK